MGKGVAEGGCGYAGLSRGHGQWDPPASLPYLIAVGMSANGDGLGPARDKAGDVFADDGLTKDCTPKDVPDSSIGTLPHLLQFELCEE